MTPDALLPAIASTMGALVAAVTGFGLGSFLTPALARTMPIGDAIVLAAIPHAVATAYRLWLIRGAVDRPLLRSFGVASAAGGLLGAVVATSWQSSALLLVFGLLLVSSGLTALTGVAARMPASRALSMAGGVLSGFFGGLAGNQGGVRAAALLSARVSRDGFVATATASAMLVDLVRVPLYVARAPDVLSSGREVLVWSCVGAALGTAVGMRALRAIPESRFRAVVSTTVLVLGLWIVIDTLR
jgi:uncharacterized protein